jgi:hypothetical protein
MAEKPIKTVGELIEALSKFDPKLPVLESYEGLSVEIEGVELREPDSSFPKKHVLLY